MEFKLIAIDIDGTLTNSKKEISPRTRYAVIEAQKLGKRIVIASGRHPLGVMPVAEELRLSEFGGIAMCFNGGKIIDCGTGQTIVSRVFPREYLSDIIGVLADSNITVMTFDEKRIYSNEKVNDYTYIESDIIKAEMVSGDDFVSMLKFDFNKLLLAGEPYELDKYETVLSKRYDGLLSVYKSAPYFLEILPFGISKGAMLAQLIDKLGINREEVMAFGDNYNDLTMIGYAGMGVVMGNGESEIRKIADYVCGTNDNDGVAATIEKFILKA